MEKPEEVSETDPDAVTYGQVPSWLNREYFQNNLWPQPKDAEKIIKSCEVTPATAAGDNYASVLYRAKLTTEDGNTHWVIAKCLPSNPMRQMMSEQLGTFRKEIFLYQEVLPAYAQLYQRMGMKGSPPWAKCLHTNRDGVRDMIIMEDLKQKGYVMGNRINGLTVEQLRLVLTSLGLYHALSLVYRKENADDFHSKVKKQFEMPKSALEMMRPLMAGNVAAIETLVRGWGFNAEADKIATMKDSCVDSLVEIIEDMDEKSAVINHGDFWINNLLFKDTPEGGKKLKILDFQIPWYTSPALDLIYLMGSSTNAEIRKRYWKTLLEEAYLSAVGNTLKKLGHADLLKDGLYTMDWLCKELEKKKVYAFYTVITTTVMVLANPEDIPDMDTLKEEDLCQENSLFTKGMKGKTYQKRFREWLDEFIQQGIL